MMQKHTIHNNYTEKKNGSYVINFGQVASISIVVLYFVASVCGGWIF